MTKRERNAQYGRLLKAYNATLKIYEMVLAEYEKLKKDDS